MKYEKVIRMLLYNKIKIDGCKYNVCLHNLSFIYIVKEFLQSNTKIPEYLM